jgi:hypothetical protein
LTVMPLPAPSMVTLLLMSSVSPRVMVPPFRLVANWMVSPLAALASS